jgi:adenine-specific DNA methylase
MEEFEQFYQRFPATRYQGSKYKLTPWIRECLECLDFQSVLDVFGGTAAVSYLFKSMNKKVYYNDLLKFNALVGKALIENDEEKLSDAEVESLCEVQEGVEYTGFIQKTFSDIYYTEEENQWLDRVIPNILSLKNEYKKAIAFWALFQSCMIKRPYNLFHRKNLSVRTSNVKRSFGNKVTWDKPFDEHFRKFVKQANQAVFKNDHQHQAHCQDALELSVQADLVYIDPPYIPKKGSLTLYRDFYHFLEGMVDYDEWEGAIDYTSKHRRLSAMDSPWEDRERIFPAFQSLLAKFRASTLVLSYRSDGLPTIEELVSCLNDLGKKPLVREKPYQYALSNKRESKEVLIIAR